MKQTRAQTLLLKYQEVLKLMHEEAKSQGRAFMGYAYIRTNDSISKNDAVDGIFTNELYLTDSHEIVERMKEQLLG